MAPTTFSDLVDRWEAEHAPRLRGGAKDARAARRHLCPIFGDVRLDALRRGDLIAATGRLIRAGKPSAARRAHALAQRILGWGLARNWLDGDPFARMRYPAPLAARHRVLDDDEIAAVWRAAGEVGGSLGPVYRLIILTGCRRGEAANLSWADLDDPERPRLWTIPAGKAKNGEVRRLPLSRAAADLIAAQPRGEGLVFPGQGWRVLAGWPDAQRRMRARVDTILGRREVEPWSPHDSRRTFRTLLSRLGARPDDRR